MEGEIQRKDPSEVIEYPENYEEMKKKLLEREEEQLKKVLTRRKADSEHELESIATQAIVTRANRAASEHKPLKDRTILREAKSEDILDLKKKLNEEINAIGQRVLKESKKETPRELKGRISQAPAQNHEI